MGLLVFALMTDADAGGPLAGPFLVLVAAALGGVLTAAVLFPSLLIAEKVGRLRWLVAVGIAATVLGLLFVGLSTVTSMTTKETMIGWSVATASSILPLTAWFGIATIGSWFRRQHH
ncbi:hypothetical protein KRMM14A1004_37750 [Krasilnikovia sp. MM14-A1004]